MITLNDRQTDSLSELINIAFSRSASSLSELTGRRVLISAPEVQMLPLPELMPQLKKFVSGEVATVHQIFSGPVGGDVFLLFDHNAALKLTQMMTNTQSLPGRLDASLGEVLTEVGNILLNACLGMFGNLLQVRVSFNVPRLHLETLNSFLDSVVVGPEELRYALVASTSFEIRESSIQGYLVIVLGVTSMEKLLQTVEKLG